MLKGFRQSPTQPSMDVKKVAGAGTAGQTPGINPGGATMAPPMAGGQGRDPHGGMLQSTMDQPTGFAPPMDAPTPPHRKKKVDFKAMLQQALAGGQQQQYDPNAEFSHLRQEDAAMRGRIY